MHPGVLNGELKKRWGGQSLPQQLEHHLLYHRKVSNKTTSNEHMSSEKLI